MIKTIQGFFRDLGMPNSDRAAMTDADIHMISAALMTEVMLSDGHAGEMEKSELLEILTGEFGFNYPEAEDFIERARHKVRDSTSLFEFTDFVNRHFDNQDKFRLVSHLWQVAQADGVVHKLEEATIRKIADLIYLSHSAFIRAKQLAR